jgi:hypothetical protein
MSTDFRPIGKIRFDDLFTTTLAGGRVREHIVHREDDIQKSETTRCLTDGVNYVWAFRDDFGFVHSFTRTAGNHATFILQAVIDAFDTGIVSEYEPRYWGFDTEEEWQAGLENMHGLSDSSAAAITKTSGHDDDVPF